MYQKKDNHYENGFKNNKAGNSAEIFSEKIFTKNRVYYIDARKHHTKNLSSTMYITLTESRKTNQGQQRSRIFIADEDVDNLIETLKQIADKMRNEKVGSNIDAEV